MGVKRVEYQIIGRYMNGTEVTAYHLMSLESGKSGRYTREQVVFLVGRGQVTNCTGQLYQDKVLLRGNGCSLEDLPVQQEDGSLRNSEQLGHIRKGTTGTEAMQQLILIGCFVKGRNTVGYRVRNAGGGEATLNREELLELARNGQIGNARVQQYNGKPILKGVGCDLKKLPRVDVTQQALAN